MKNLLNEVLVGVGGYFALVVVGFLAQAVMEVVQQRQVTYAALFSQWAVPLLVVGVLVQLTGFAFLAMAR